MRVKDYHGAGKCLSIFLSFYLAECAEKRLTWMQAVFDVDFAHGLTLIEIADGVTVDEVKSKTGAPFTVADDLKPMQ